MGGWNETRMEGNVSNEPSGQPHQQQASTPDSQKPLKPQPIKCRCGSVSEAEWVPEYRKGSFKVGGFWREPSSDCFDCRDRNLQAELKRNEKFQQEEAVRKWCSVLGGVRAYETFTLKDFVPHTPPPSDFPISRSAYIYGPTGTGKTHLATAWARSLASNWSDVRVLKQTELIRSMRRAELDGDAAEQIAYYARKKLLVIDDVGTAKETEYAAQVLYELIDLRYMNGAGGLIITSNLSLDDLAKRLNDDRVPSRLAEMCHVIQLSGVDRRISKAPKHGLARKDILGGNAYQPEPEDFLGAEE